MTTPTFVIINKAIISQTYYHSNFDRLMNILLFHFINSGKEKEIKHNKVGDWVTAIAWPITEGSRL